jgi:hypothetical protein
MLHVLSLSLTLLAFGDQTWKDKQIGEWTEEDARQVLADSPWVVKVTAEGAPVVLTLRWESALPIRAAQLKSRDAVTTSIGEKHYAVAVYGLPGKYVVGDSKSEIEQLKRQAVIKREGKKDIRPSAVQLVELHSGPVILYLFPRSAEITRQDGRIEFSAQIGKLRLSQFFAVDEMSYRGKLEL